MGSVRDIERVLTLICCFLLASCSESYERSDLVFRLATWISGLPPQGYIPAEMQALCDQDAGSKITQLYNVDGYSVLPRADLHPIEDITKGIAQHTGEIGGCYPCLKELVEQQFDYVETMYQSAADRYELAHQHGSRYSRRWFEDQYPNQTGLYRYQLVDRATSDVLCVPFDEAVKRAAQDHDSPLAKPQNVVFWRHYLELKDQLADRCVVAKRIDQFEAPIAFTTEKRRMTSIRWRLVAGHVSMYKESVVDHRSGEVVSRGVVYRYLVHRGGDRFHRISGCGATGLPNRDTHIFSLSNDGAPE